MSAHLCVIGANALQLCGVQVFEEKCSQNSSGAEFCDFDFKFFAVKPN